MAICSLSAVTALGLFAFAQAKPWQQYAPIQQQFTTAQQQIPAAQNIYVPQTTVPQGFEVTPSIPISTTALPSTVPYPSAGNSVSVITNQFEPTGFAPPQQTPSVQLAPAGMPFQHTPQNVGPVYVQPGLQSVDQPAFPSTNAGDFTEGFQAPLAPVQQPAPTQPAPIQQPAQTQHAQNSYLNGWQAPTIPTPGHNERVNMNPNLSLSPPPQPGAPVNEYLPVQPPAFQAEEQLPNFDRQVGHRSAKPTKRFDVYPLDDGEKFGFETKKREFPPFGEIIATGRFFYMAEALWAEPQFQGNTLIATESLNFGESIPDDFDSDFHPRFRFGFESPYGPGIEFSYFNINSNSEIASFTSNGIVTGQTNAWVIGRNIWSRIVADDAGETLATQHSIDIDSGTVSFFKELKFPISRVNGNFGFQYVSIAQQLNANVTGADGVTVETLQSVTDMRAYGPRAIIEYYRPIGHTPLELVTTFGGAVLFGQRDQVVTNSQTGLENRLGADEFLTILDFLVALQYTKTVGENRAWYGRFGFMNQTWIGGGTAAFPQGDFGLRGLTFGIGYNR